MNLLAVLLQRCDVDKRRFGHLLPSLDCQLGHRRLVALLLCLPHLLGQLNDVRGLEQTRRRDGGL